MIKDNKHPWSGFRHQQQFIALLVFNVLCLCSSGVGEGRGEGERNRKASDTSRCRKNSVSFIKAEGREKNSVSFIKAEGREKNSVSFIKAEGRESKTTVVTQHHLSRRQLLQITTECREGMMSAISSLHPRSSAHGPALSSTLPC